MNDGMLEDVIHVVLLHTPEEEQTDLAELVTSQHEGVPEASYG